jgi:hypothetical protein
MKIKYVITVGPMTDDKSITSCNVALPIVLRRIRMASGIPNVRTKILIMNECIQYRLLP